MSLTSYRAAPPRANRRTDDGRRRTAWLSRSFCFHVVKEEALGVGDETAAIGGLPRSSVLDRPMSVVCCPISVLCRPGDDLLSHVLRQSTIGAKAFDGRVRDGIGSDRLARATRPAKDGVRTSSDVRSKQNWFVVADLTTDTKDGGTIRRLSSVVRARFRAHAPWRREQSSRTSD